MSKHQKNNSDFIFTFKKLEDQYKKALDLGYSFMTCYEYFKEKPNPSDLVVVNRVDVDLSIPKSLKLNEIFNKLGIKASFFIRLHAAEYNPMSFEAYRVIKEIYSNDHEIGYHSEIIDQATIWNEDAKECLVRDLQFFKHYFGIDIKGVASHGGITGLNNLDFWNEQNVSDYGFLYEAYSKDESFNLFDNSLYVSDSEWTQWKSYKNGLLQQGDTRTFGEHLDEKPNLIYLLIHPDTYYVNHIYE